MHVNLGICVWQLIMPVRCQWGTPELGLLRLGVVGRHRRCRVESGGGRDRVWGSVRAGYRWLPLSKLEYTHPEYAHIRSAQGSPLPPGNCHPTGWTLLGTLAVSWAGLQQVLRHDSVSQCENARRSGWEMMMHLQK